MTRRPRIALLSRIVKGNEAAMRRLHDAGVGIDLDLNGYEALDGDRRALHARVSQIDALVVGLQPVDAALLTAAPRLRYVLQVGTGLDNIDVDVAAAHGVTVDTLAGFNAEAVSEYAFGLLLAASRRIAEADAAVREGRWGRFPGRQLSGRRLGLVGYGEIGRLMVPKARGFGMEVVVHRRRPGDERGEDVRTVSLDELVSTSQFISVHVPLTDRTRSMIGPREIDMMDQTVLVNTARGGIVDDDALYHGLTTGRVAACGLDVFATEPPTGSPLLGLRNVVLSSHTAGHGDLVMAQIATAAVDKLVARLASHVHDADPPAGTEPS